MPPRQVTCPKCKTKLTAPEGAPRFRCPKCKTALAAPGQAAAQPLRPAAPEEELVGQQLSGYKVTRLIGSGGMGTVYEALQEGLKRRVALKVLPDRATQDAAFLSTFRREAQAVAKLNHPHIIQIFDIVEDKGFHFFSMEFVDGESLSARLEREGRIPASDALDMLVQVAHALDHAYEHMLVHRDLKPSNILIGSRGEVKVADLGLSKSLEETSVGIVRGTHGGPVYMAPEFARNPQLADCRSDIYALGCVLFHLVTGKPPFPGPSLADLLDQHAKVPFPSAREVAPEIPETVDALLQKMCAKDPADRFQTYGELIGQLQLLLKATAVRFPRRQPIRASRPSRPRRSRRWPFFVAAAVAVLAIAAAAFLLIPGLRPGRTRASVPLPTEATTPGPKEVKPPSPTPEPPKPPTPKPEDDKKAPEPKKSPEPKEKEPGKVPEPKKPDETAKGTPKQETPKGPEKEPGKEATKEPKEEPPKGEEKPKEVEKPPEGATPEARLAEAKKTIEALLKDRQFGRALTFVEALAKDIENAELKKQAEDAAAAIRKKAAEAYNGVRDAAVALAAQGKLAEARAALQAVADQFGTEQEAGLAKAALAALGQHEQAAAALAKAAEQAAADAAAAATRAAREADLAKALAPIAGLLAKWDFAAAAQRLAAIKADDEAAAAELAPRKAAIEAAAALRTKMIHAIKTAQPRLKRGQMRMAGAQGDLLSADEKAITIQTEFKFGDQVKTEDKEVLWTALRDVSIEALFDKAADHNSPADQLGAALLLHIAGSAKKAEEARQRAERLKAKTDRALDFGKADERFARDAEAAQALADALKSLLAQKQQDALAALEDYQKKFAETPRFAASKKLLEAALAFIKPFSPPSAAVEEAPKPPETKGPETKGPETKGPETKAPEKQPPPPKAQVEPFALELYNKAVAAARIHHYDDCKDALDTLLDKFPKSPLLTDAERKPSVADLRKAIDDRGPTLKVAHSGEGAKKSISQALKGLKEPNATIEIGGGTYPGAAEIEGKNCHGLILRGVSKEPPILDGGGKVILNCSPGVKDLWLEGLVFRNAKSAISLGQGVTAGLHQCIAFKDIGRALDADPKAVVTLSSCLLKVDTLGVDRADACAFFCADNADIGNAKLTDCILVGNNLRLAAAELTDCLILGSATLFKGTRLTHVTAIGPLYVPTADPEKNRDVAISQSLLGSLEVEDPGRQDPKQKPPPALALKDVVLYRQPARPKLPFPEAVVKSEGVSRAEGKDADHTEKALFADPGEGDWKLRKDSPYRKRDGNDLGCRFRAPMAELLEVAKSYRLPLHPPKAPKGHTR